MRTKSRFRPFFMLLVLGLLGFVIYYMRCGDGFGLGPGDGTGPGGESRDGDKQADGERDPAATEEAPDVRPAVGGAAKRRCKLRLDSGGLTLDEEPSSVEKAVEACKKAGGAELTATGDAMFGEFERVRDALDRANVEVFVRDRGTVPAK
ncbi:MAG TPA: hypothetical protein VNO33_02735 [Kofleriaceae bacterium]|nr:hypothetical protein [Kofleriaceae bacterium]